MTDVQLVAFVEGDPQLSIDIVPTANEMRELFGNNREVIAVLVNFLLCE